MKPRNAVARQAFEKSLLQIANAPRRPTGAGRIAAGETARFKLLEVDGSKGADV